MGGRTEVRAGRWRRALRPLRFLFGFRLPVGRRAYAVAGFSLAVLKVGVDQLVLHAVTDRWWGAGEYLRLARVEVADQIPERVLAGLMAWAVPFAWIALSMSVRRALDAGVSPWVGLLVCVPMLNVVVMLALCLPPSAPPRERPEARQRRVSAWRAIGAAVLVAVAVTIVSVRALHEFGLVLFLGTPLGMGVVAGFLYNRGRREPRGSYVLLSLATLAVGAAVVLLFAVEGALCLAMALPLAAPLAIMGGYLGQQVALAAAWVRSPAPLLLVALPLLAGLEPAVRADRPAASRRLHAVSTRIHVAAPVGTVWRRVVAFPPLPPPEEPWFRLGIAYPTAARIAGAGPGAVRLCVFSTGAFVEPITAWEAPRRLAFDVTAQPAPLRELSPYRRVWADHLHGTITSRRGEFRLEPAPEGGTVLTGTTWYDLGLAPDAYWSLWSDLLIREIHLRVLRHVAALAEADARAGRRSGGPRVAETGRTLGR